MLGSDDQVDHRLPEHFGAGEAEDFLRTAVPREDRPVTRDGDEGIGVPAKLSLECHEDAARRT